MKSLLCCLVIFLFPILISAQTREDDRFCFGCNVKGMSNDCQNPSPGICPTKNQSCLTKFYDSGLVERGCLSMSNGTTHLADQCIYREHSKVLACICNTNLCNDPEKDPEDKKPKNKDGGTGGSAEYNKFNMLMISTISILIAFVLHN
ncbi:hypothetical protein M3Y97_01099200 [Aphelenchoides bicaudatus]|nr:hypothetical protein M3Y97_01099200 [Aphelenchoides bicaudatus]